MNGVKERGIYVPTWGKLFLIGIITITLAATVGFFAAAFEWFIVKIICGTLIIVGMIIGFSSIAYVKDDKED